MQPIHAIIIKNKSSGKLEQLLTHHHEITIVDKTNELEQAFFLIAKHNPDMVFLDFDSLVQKEIDILHASLKNKYKFPTLILSTTKTKKWNEDFNFEHVLTLEKPLTHGMVNQVIKQFHIDRTRNEKKYSTITCPFCKRNGERIMIPIITGLKNIIIQDILYIKKDNNNGNKIYIYLDLYNHNQEFSGYITLKQIKKALSAHSFFQINRSTIINLNYLREIITKSKICIIAKNDSVIELPISRAHLKDLREHHIFCY